MHDNQSNERAGLGNISRESEYKYIYSEPARYCCICGTWLLHDEMGECGTCTRIYSGGEA